MDDNAENKATPNAPPVEPVSLTVTAPAKSKAKSETKHELKASLVKVRLTGAGSCNLENVIVKKNEVVELETSQAERFIKSGLFVKA